MQEESKPSPLTLLAQTCNSIGRDAASTKSKSADEVKTLSSGGHGRPRDSPSDAERRSTSRDPPQIDVDKTAVVAATRLTSSPVDAETTSGPTKTSAATVRTLSAADTGRRRAGSSSPVKASPPPPPPLLGSPSPSRHGKAAAADYRSKSASFHCGSDPDGLYAMQYLAAVAALQRQSAAVDAGLLPYLAAQRLPVPLNPFALSDRPSQCAGVGPLSPAAAGRLKPGSCSDPRCSRCLQLGALATSARGAGYVGCSQCGNHQPATSSSSSSALLPGGHGAFAAALSALCRLPPPVPPPVSYTHLTLPTILRV